MATVPEDQGKVDQLSRVRYVQYNPEESERGGSRGNGKGKGKGKDGDEHEVNPFVREDAREDDGDLPGPEARGILDGPKTIACFGERHLAWHKGDS